ncbi:hypothetical protein CEXT_689961 [Caerostris extrusa]|uniref:Uncharacterized protein n=1 Tax=Caerostris extrusa TaxID=172846 RepID=A0AAV4TBU9_CAEEX|nr:hypothetical protein CEXT_689961 [Caerostris extrusa]
MEMWSKHACLACVLSSSAETILPVNPLRDCKRHLKSQMDGISLRTFAADITPELEVALTLKSESGASMRGSKYVKDSEKWYMVLVPLKCDRLLQKDHARPCITLLRTDVMGYSRDLRPSG